MKKRVLATMMVAAMSASLLAGCGGNSTPKETKAPAGETAASGEAGGHKLTAAAWDKNFNIPALEAAAADYKANVDPDFELEIIEQAQSSDVENAITLAGSSGDYSTLPDIVLFQDHYIQRYVADYPDAFVDVDDADVDWSDFGAEKLSFSTIDGKHYGFPVDNGTVIFAYRTDLLAECGYTIDDVTGITWDRFIEIGKEVQAKTGKYLLCMDGDGNDLFYMMLQAEGESQFKDGDAVLAGNEKLTKIMELLVTMVNENILYLANDWGAYTDQAIQGDMVAGVMNGNWIIPTIKKVTDNAGKWEITSLPTIEGGEGYASNGGSSLYITGNCQDVDLAKKFLAYTFGGSSVTYDAALENGGVITTCISAGQSDVYNEADEYFNGQPIYAKIVEMGSHVPVVEQSDFHYATRKQLAIALINITQNGASVEDAMAEAQSQIDFEMGK